MSGVATEASIYIDRIYAPVTTLGPGERIALWTSGCSKRCEGCANLELWEARPDQAVEPKWLADTLNDMAKRTGIHRLTVTGGDPLEQPEALAAVLEAVRPAFDDILVYTGYTAYQLAEVLSPAVRDRLRPLVDVLVDGPYVAALNDGRCALRGSANQSVIVRTPGLQNVYDDEVRKPRRIQNAVFDGRAFSIGIHGRPQEEQSDGSVQRGEDAD